MIGPLPLIRLITVALVGLARDKGENFAAFCRCVCKLVEAQSCLACRRVGTMTREAVLRQNRANVAVITEFACGRGLFRCQSAPAVGLRKQCRRDQQKSSDCSAQHRRRRIFPKIAVQSLFLTKNECYDSHNASQSEIFYLRQQDKGSCHNYFAKKF